MSYEPLSFALKSSLNLKDYGTNNTYTFSAASGSGFRFIFGQSWGLQVRQLGNSI